ncbi:MAG: thioesterase family protein [Acidimicrobiia bacterium]|nr:thioesterase family protein [Acidimicrobiia bacterium]
MPNELFLPVGAGAFQPTDLTRGPWSPLSQHGGPPSALLACAVESTEPTSMFVARFTVEFIRPVPLTPLTLASRVTRPGRRVQLIEATLAAAGELVARAMALRIRVHEGVDIPLEAGGPVETLPPPDTVEPVRLVPVDWGNFGDALETRPLVGGLIEPGPSVAWFRLRVPVVQGEEPSPLQRVLVAADCGNGISSAVDIQRYLFINPDLTVYQHRPASGEWIGLDALTRLERQGIGLAEAALFDERGRLGRSLQSLYVDER